MPVVTIDMWEGRTIEQKKRLVADITSVIMNDLNVPAEQIQIIIKDNPKHNWGIAGKLASEESPGT